MSENNVESGNKQKPKVIKEEPTSPSGSACICKPQQRNIKCLVHGG